MGAPARGRRQRVDAFDAGVLVCLGILSVWLLAVLLSKQGTDHVWTGTDGPYVGDQLQYLAWIREAARHVLMADPFRVEPSAASFLHPGLVLSGALTHLGVSPSIAYLAWKPFAVVGLFAAVRAYVDRLLRPKLQRRAALVIALFYLSPAFLVASKLHWADLVSIRAIVFEMWPGLYLWGYPFTALAVAALVGTLLAYQRDRDDGRLRLSAPLLGLTCAWLQPWQGATVIAILLVAEAVLWARGLAVRPLIPAVTIGATIVPLGYYSLLSHFDSTWKLAGEANRVPLAPNWTLFVALAPLALPSLIAYARPVATFQDVAVRAWPVAALGVYFLIGLTHVGTFPLHALQGLSIPFAVLAIVGARTLRPGSSAAVGARTLRPRWSAAVGAVAVVSLLLLLLVPSVEDELSGTRMLGEATIFGRVPFFITGGEHDALEYLRRSSVRGAVLAPVFLGETVPAETGRRTWVGIASWTPNYSQRVGLAEQFFSGSLEADAARRFVRATGVRWLLSDCTHRVDLTPTLQSMLLLARHFACATVYELR
jgi:hypothetical protein